MGCTLFYAFSTGRSLAVGSEVGDRQGSVERGGAQAIVGTKARGGSENQWVETFSMLLALAAALL